MITLRFSGGLGLMGQMVQAATWSWASHVEFELEGGRLLLGAVPGRGVCVRDPRDDAPSRVERYGVRMGSPAPICVAHDQLGKPYDWAGVLGWGLRREWQEEDRWFCSELVAWAFQSAGHPLLRAEDAWRITPRDLFLSPHLVPLDKWICRKCSHACESPDADPVGYCLLGHRAPLKGPFFDIVN